MLKGKQSIKGNNNSKVITNKIKFVNNIVKYNAKTEKYEPVIELNESPRKVMGTLYVSNFDPSEENTALQIEVRQVGTSDKITIKCSDLNEMWQIGLKLGAAFETTKNSEGAVEITTQNNQVKYVKKYEAGYGSYYPIVNDEEAAEDIVHDSLIKANEKCLVFPSLNDAKYWLIRVVKNASLNYIKRKDRERKAYEKVLYEDKHKYDSGETSLLKKDSIQKAREALKKLPKNLQEVLMLKEYGDLNYKEIGQILGITEGNVKVRVFRAREQLVKLIGEDDVFLSE